MKIYNIGASVPTPPLSLSHGLVPQPAHSHAHSHLPPPPVHTPELATPSPRPTVDHRTPPSSAGSGPSSPFPGGHTVNPFTPFRMPVEMRLPHSSFNRQAALEIPMDLLDHYRMRQHLVSSAIDAPFSHPYDRNRPMSTLESQIYSQRLKQLANPSLPPGIISPVSGVPFPQSGMHLILSGERSSRGGRDSVGSGRDSSGGADHDRDREDRGGRPPSSESAPAGSTPSSALPTLPNKLKSCEFCGKMFRFQSNLIVHRRSHTGEKPFKCPVCPHACTQQSKLKRHMKTHSARSLASARQQHLGSNPGSSDGSVRSTSSTPDSTRHKNDDTFGLEDEDDDIEDEEDGEEDEEDMEEDFTDGELDSAQEGESSDGFHGLKGDGGRGSEKDHHGGLDSDAGTPGLDTTQRCPSASLVSEVMKNTGLNSIQPYNEAFQAALAEKFSKEGLKDVGLRHSKENGEGDGEDERDRSKLDRSPSSRGGGSSSARDSLFLGGTSLLDDKPIKREPGDAASPLEVSSAASLYGRLPVWLRHDGPSLRAHPFFPGFPPTFALQPDFPRDSHNGYSPGSSAAVLASDSALKVPPSGLAGLSGLSKSDGGGSGGGGASSLLAGSNGSSTVLPRKDKRNDTCEFCGKVFKNCSNLTVHRRSHTGEKPYKCSLCNYACAQSSKLTRHMKTHGRIGKDVLKCKFCNMPFSVPSTLEKHMRKCVESRNARIMAAAEQENSDNSTSASNMANRSTPRPSSPEEAAVDSELDNARRRNLKAEPSWSY